MTEVNHGEGLHYSVSLSLVIYFVIVICLPTKHLGETLLFWNLEDLISEERGKPE